MPTASVNLLAATSMVVAPDADGLNMAVYTVELVAVKLLIVPPDTVMSVSYTHLTLPTNREV